MKLHPRFKNLCRLIDKHREELVTGWRFQALTHPTEADILGGEGARIHGGRWNTRGLFPAIYGNSTGEVAMRESEALDRYYGLVTRKARLFVCLSLRITKVLDLSQTRHLKKLDLVQTHLNQEDWRRLQDRNVESLTQCIGRAASDSEIEAILTRSAAVKGGLNITLFPHRILPVSQVIPNDAEAIESWVKNNSCIFSCKFTRSRHLKSNEMIITGEAIQSLQSRYGFTQLEIGLISGYAPRSIANWLKGTKPTPAARQKFVELRRLFTALEDLVEDPNEVKDWINEPNSAFEGSTPRQVIERGESDRLWRMIYFLEAGQPG